MHKVSQIRFLDLIATPIGYQASSKLYKPYVMHFLSIPWLVLPFITVVFLAIPLHCNNCIMKMRGWHPTLTMGTVMLRSTAGQIFFTVFQYECLHSLARQGTITNKWICIEGKNICPDRDRIISVPKARIGSEYYSVIDRIHSWCGTGNVISVII
jgi:hypothetical protein